MKESGMARNRDGGEKAKAQSNCFCVFEDPRIEESGVLHMGDLAHDDDEEEGSDPQDRRIWATSYG